MYVAPVEEGIIGQVSVLTGVLLTVHPAGCTITQAGIMAVQCFSAELKISIPGIQQTTFHSSQQRKCELGHHLVAGYHRLSS